MKAVRSYGGVDIVVNAAGIRGTGPGDRDVPRTLGGGSVDTNLTGTYLVARGSRTPHDRSKAEAARSSTSPPSPDFAARPPAPPTEPPRRASTDLTEAMATRPRELTASAVNCVASRPRPPRRCNGRASRNVDARGVSRKRVPLGRIGEPEDNRGGHRLSRTRDAGKHVTERHPPSHRSAPTSMSEIRSARNPLSLEWNHCIVWTEIG